MATKDTSAGIVLCRQGPDGPEILLAHPGGPFWRNKNAHSWSIPKGIVERDEDREAAAKREFAEEVGAPPPDGELRALPILDIGKKYVAAFLLCADFDISDFGTPKMQSNTFEIQWPPQSGKYEKFTEVDQLGWFNLNEAETLLHKGQVPLCGFIRDALCG